MAEYLYLALSAVVFIVGLVIGIMLLRKSMKEQMEYEQQLRNLAASGSPAAGAPTETAPAPAETPAPPTEAEPSGGSEAEAKAKVETAKGEIEKLRGEGVDVSSADKLLQLATSCLYSGDFDRAVKYATKASKVGKDLKERAATEKPAGEAPAPAAAEGEDAQQKEVVNLISAVQAKLANVKEDSVEKSEVENMLRLATSFVRSKSYPKALRYAKQAEEKVNALAK